MFRVLRHVGHFFLIVKGYTNIFLKKYIFLFFYTNKKETLGVQWSVGVCRRGQFSESMPNCDQGSHEIVQCCQNLVFFKKNTKSKVKKKQFKQTKTLLTNILKIFFQIKSCFRNIYFVIFFLKRKIKTLKNKKKTILKNILAGSS